MSKKYKTKKLDKQMRERLDFWFYIYRRIYNNCIEKFNKGQKMSKKYLSQRVVLKNRGNWLSKIKYFKESKIYTDICYEAIKEFEKNRTMCFKNLKESKIKFFKMKFKTFKQDQCFIIRKRFLKKISDTVFSSKNKHLSFELYGKGINLEDIPNSNCNSVKIFKCRNTRRIFIVESYVQKKVLYKPEKKISVLDPGEVTFQTCCTFSTETPESVDVKYYAPSTRNLLEYYKIRISSLNSKLSKIKRKKGKVYCKKRYNIRKRIKVLRSKSNNKIYDLHHKVAKDVIENSDVVLIGDMSAKEVTSKNNNLTKNIKNNLLSLRHFSFRQLLKHKCEKHGRLFFEINEKNSTKQCFNCGSFNFTNSRIYKCKNCGNIDHRDINPCKNMLQTFKNTL